MKVRQRKELSDGFLICLEDGSEIKVSEELYFTRYLYEAEELGKEEIEEIRFLDMVLQAEIFCRKKLAGGLRPRSRLFDMLITQGFSERAAQTALSNLIRDKYLDDTKLALKKLKRKMISSPMASNTLILWLVAQGIDADTASKTVNLAGIDDRVTARMLMEKKFKGSADRLKIAKYLASRGFERDIIAEVTGMEDLWNV